MRSTPRTTFRSWLGVWAAVRKQKGHAGRQSGVGVGVEVRHLVQGPDQGEDDGLVAQGVVRRALKSCACLYRGHELVMPGYVCLPQNHPVPRADVEPSLFSSIHRKAKLMLPSQGTRLDTFRDRQQAGTSAAWPPRGTAHAGREGEAPRLLQAVHIVVKLL